MTRWMGYLAWGCCALLVGVLVSDLPLVRDEKRDERCRRAGL